MDLELADLAGLAGQQARKTSGLCFSRAGVIDAPNFLTSVLGTQTQVYMATILSSESSPQPNFVILERVSYSPSDLKFIFQSKMTLNS